MQSKQQELAQEQRRLFQEWSELRRMMKESKNPGLVARLHDVEDQIKKDCRHIEFQIRAERQNEFVADAMSDKGSGQGNP